MKEQVQVVERRFGVFPARFNRAGQVVRVDAVEHCWTEMNGYQGGPRYHFRIRCGSERFHLSEDTGSGAWTIRTES